MGPGGGVPRRGAKVNSFKVDRVGNREGEGVWDAGVSLWKALAQSVSCCQMSPVWFPGRSREACLLMHSEYRGTSSIRNRLPVGSYSRAMPRALWWS